MEYRLENPWLRWLLHLVGAVSIVALLVRLPLGEMEPSTRWYVLAFVVGIPLLWLSVRLSDYFDQEAAAED